MASDFFSISSSTYKGDVGYGSYQPGKVVKYPCSQRFDYDRYRQEVLDKNPDTPATDNTNPGNNAVTDFLNKLLTSLGLYPDTKTNTCECECACKEDPTQTVIVNCSGQDCGCESCPPPEPDPDNPDSCQEYLCKEIHKFVEKTQMDATDMFINLEDKNTENTTSSNFRDALIRAVNKVLNRECYRREKGKYFFGGLAVQRPPDDDGVTPEQQIAV